MSNNILYGTGIVDNETGEYKTIEELFSSTGLAVEDITTERLLDGLSTTTPQEPSARGEANAVQVDFGPTNTTNTHVHLAANGAVTFNTSGLYRIKVALQFGRAGASGTSIILFRVLVNGTQAGRSIISKLSSADETQYFENDTWIYFPAGTTLTFEVMRELSGSNFGGLIGFDPTDEGAGTWNNAPSAAIRVERLAKL
jgi:hypothetical protein